MECILHVWLIYDLFSAFLSPGRDRLDPPSTSLLVVAATPSASLYLMHTHSLPLQLFLGGEYLWHFCTSLSLFLPSRMWGVILLLFFFSHRIAQGVGF